VDDRIAALRARDDVRAACRRIETHDEQTLALQDALVRIPAPTGAEGARAAFVADRMRAIGLADVRTDAAGNVLGALGGAARPCVVLCAHLDTVFPAGTDLTLTLDGERRCAPGIGDNARGLAAMLAVAEACAAVPVRLPGHLLFVASVGEEGAGNLRGVTHLFEDPAFRPAAFIALDGPGLDRVVHRGNGSRRQRVSWSGPGGHSWAAFGVANPACAAGLAIARLAELPLPVEPRVTLSVVRLGGGTSLNTIPSEAWIELDLRAEDCIEMDRVAAQVAHALHTATTVANQRRAPGTAPLGFAVTDLGERPCGSTPLDHPLVRAAFAATRAVGATPVAASASTDANVPMRHGVPAVALAAGGRGGDAHLVTEWYDNAGGPAGITRALLLALAALELPAASDP
jgi:acetylornithine deacetylase/succinyl-diaminopimelate desuccinylase-like protein